MEAGPGPYWEFVALLRWSRVERVCSSADGDVFPETEAVSDLLHPRTRRLIGPGAALMAHAIHHYVIELDTMRTGMVGIRLRRFLEPFRAHCGAREVLVAPALNSIVALGDHLAVQQRFHA